MSNAREPRLLPVPILSLRPTQMTVGIREVKEKRKHWRKFKSKTKQEKVLGTHMIPVVLGPGGERYVVDHHHLARALHDEGVKDVLVSVIADLSMVKPGEFWSVLDHKRWVYPYDGRGVRHQYNDIPKDVTKLKDDPYRSLAGELRRVGGYSKDTLPFSEFLWADFLRNRVSRKLVGADFEDAIAKALALAKSKDAVYLPGWCGAVSDD
jgi:hypothetical protein